MRDKIDYRNLAWFFEGEGTVAYYKRSNGSRKGYLMASVCGTNRKLMEEIYRQINVKGCLYISQRAGQYGSKKDAWRVHWAGYNALIVLAGMLPYFNKYSEKLPQVEFALRVGATSTDDQIITMKNFKHEKNQSRIETSQNVLDFPEAL